MRQRRGRRGLIPRTGARIPQLYDSFLGHSHLLIGHPSVYCAAAYLGSIASALHECSAERVKSPAR